MTQSEGPWIRFASVSPDERARRLTEAERLHADAEQRAAELHATWFGSVRDRTVAWVDMPLSKMSYGWRADGYIAVLPTAGLNQLPDRNAEVQPDGEPLWHPWVGPDSGIEHGGEVPPGDSPGPTWWLASGLAYPNDTVRCWLADDSDVPVTRIGCWWIVEYVSQPQTLFICVNNSEVDYVRPHRPGYLRSAPHPYDGSAVDPRA